MYCIYCRATFVADSCPNCGPRPTGSGNEAKRAMEDRLTAILWSRAVWKAYERVEALTIGANARECE